jgi:predicted esterase
MKKYTLLFFILSFLIPAAAFADMIYLKSGGSVRCVIENETDYAVYVIMNTGEKTYSKDQIASISRARDEENAMLKEKWGKGKKQRQAEQEKQDLEEKPVKPVDTVRFYDRYWYTYAVRLPPQYNTKTKYPVLFCFDPGANGEDAARRFAYAADNLGWIVVGSLDSKNGPWPPIVRAQEAMLKDIPKRFSVDERRFYATGLSGGARAAATIAYRHLDQFKGIITCAMGVPYDPEQYKISKNIAVYICIGTKDFNLEAAREEYGKLRLMGAKAYKHEFEGGHEWPPPEIISQALDWMAKQ